MPFYIRTGKKLGRREMEVAVVFRTPAPEIPPVVAAGQVPAHRRRLSAI